MNYELLEALYHSYYECRKGKRNTINQLKYELDMERKLLKLCESIENRTYKPNRSICFMIDERSVKREIFAATFSDRILHRFVYDRIAPIFDVRFIEDSYSCRKGKGTHYGIRRMVHHIRSCSENYTKECYVLKLDVQGYFLAIDRSILYRQVSEVLTTHWESHSRRMSAQMYMPDLDTVLFLLQRIIFTNPTDNCIVRGTKDEWAGFPRRKSLFYSRQGCGLPIGNLTSQLFSNIYMNEFDQYAKRVLGLKHYGRYVDDFFVVHNDAGYLRSLIPIFRSFLKERLHLSLHPDKIYLQPVEHGVYFVGAYIMPHRNYPGKRTVTGFRRGLITRRAFISGGSDTLVASVNSYLGIMRQYYSYHLIHRMMREYNWIFSYGSLCSCRGVFRKQRLP